MSMAKSPVVSTRLNAEEHKRLMEICESTSLKPADIARLAIGCYFEKVEKDGGVILSVKKKK
jgi:predicted DNA-binding protein